MDTLFWKRLSPNINIESSKQQYYKQYFYKLEIYAPGCKSIRQSNIAEHIDERRRWVRDYNHGGSWWNKKLAQYLTDADIGFLCSLSDLKHEYPDVKIRTEEPKLSIFSVDELMLKSVAESIDPDFRKNIATIIGPESPDHLNLLQQNVILVKKPPKFQYRVFFKEKQFEHGVRSQILNYLSQMGELVRMSEHTKESLTKPHNWIWGCYFYTNDRGVAEMVRLIHPDVIREVSELVCMDNK